ncbi:MAG: helix-hairpin-helix domain-containing protein [Ruminococcus sp.]|jgi:competence ComEA-like helix-hairpin-helix protein|nr:helix-hairpin-helix domain-containing protein [Ruminococcus sp.]
MKDKNKGIAIGAVILSAVSYILIFNAVRVPEPSVIAFNTAYYGEEYIIAGENSGTQTEALHTENAYSESETFYTENAYAESDNAYTENAYTDTDNIYTENAYSEIESLYTESAYEIIESTYTENVSELINLNTANMEELLTLDGVGEVIAARIIEYRETYGFRSVEELMNIKGIGEAKYAKIVSHVTV